MAKATTKEDKGGRPATGWVKWRKGQWYTQITLSTGKRSPFIALHPDIPQHDRARAVACAKGVSDEARASGMIPKSEYKITDSANERIGKRCAKGECARKIGLRRKLSEEITESDLLLYDAILSLAKSRVQGVQPIMDSIRALFTDVGKFHLVKNHLGDFRPSELGEYSVEYSASKLKDMPSWL